MCIRDSIGTLIYSKTTSSSGITSFTDFEFFIKQFIQKNSLIQSSDWTVNDIKSLDGTPFTAEDLNYLRENKSAVSRIIE